MKTLIGILGSAAIAVPALAQSQTDDHASHHPVVAAAPAADLTDGEVRKVDAEAGKITLKHADIKNLEMPAMTMVFTVRDKSLLAEVKPGDKVKFAAARDGGRLVVTAIQVVRP